MRLIIRFPKFVIDLEAVLSKNVPAVSEDEEAEIHEIESQTIIDSDPEPFSEDSAVPKAKKIKGFIPNKEV